VSATLNPPSLAETINARGFSHAAAGFRIVAVEPGRAEVVLARRDDLVQFFGHFPRRGHRPRWPTRRPESPSPSGLPSGRIGVTVEIKVQFPFAGRRQRACGPRQNPENVRVDRRRYRRGLHQKRYFRTPLCLRHRHHARARSASRVPMTATEHDEFADIRDAVAKLCAQFPGEYWRKLDREMAYPSAFVDALTKAGYLSVLIPEEYGGAGHETVRSSRNPGGDPACRLQWRWLPCADVHHGHLAAAWQRRTKGKMAAEKSPAVNAAAGVRRDRTDPAALTPPR